MLERDLILFGAGTTGRIIARNNKDRVLCFVDSNPAKHGQVMEGVEVIAKEIALKLYPSATWIASVIIPELHKEITAEIERLGVKTIPVWGFLPQRLAPPPERARQTMLRIANHDAETTSFLCDQLELRRNPQHHIQIPPADISEIYFPSFITHLDNEHYVDCGAADGDTVLEFRKHWSKYAMITAFEPDAFNYAKLRELDRLDSDSYFCAVGDMPGPIGFQRTGDYSAHPQEGGNTVVECVRLDDQAFDPPPTYIKMDIEGSEPEALWGARRILKEHSPVLAICAYHEASHLWEIPLLIHALQPDYRLYFRRYAEGTFELVWYAVPPDRIAQ